MRCYHRVQKGVLDTIGHVFAHHAARLINKVLRCAHDRHGVLTALLVDVKPQERNYDSGWTHKAAIDQYIRVLQ